MSDWLHDMRYKGFPSWEAMSKADLDSQYGAAMYPKKREDGTYSRGIGHTGSPWPQGTGHDWCWAPWRCISCGCGWNGPCTSHANIARINGWDGTRGTAERWTDAD